MIRLCKAAPGDHARLAPTRSAAKLYIFVLLSEPTFHVVVLMGTSAWRCYGRLESVLAPEDVGKEARYRAPRTMSSTRSSMSSLPSTPK